VDDNNVNLLAATNALSEHCRLFTLPSASDMFDLLEDIIPDIIFLDILMPGMDGFEALELLKKNSNYTDIPVIFLTSKNDSETETLGYKMGAIDFIYKPFSEPDLLKRIKNYFNKAGVE
jgi:putative two-component system response regulator